MDENTQWVILLDIYEKLLTDTQAQILRMRYDEDLSLGEIGELCGISRQAARNAILKGEEKLRFYEDTLHIAHQDMALSRLHVQMSQSEDEEVRCFCAELEKITEAF